MIARPLSTQAPTTPEDILLAVKMHEAWQMEMVARGQAVAAPWEDEPDSSKAAWIAASLTARQTKSLRLFPAERDQLLRQGLDPDLFVPMRWPVATITPHPQPVVKELVKPDGTPERDAEGRAMRAIVWPIHAAMELMDGVLDGTDIVGAAKGGLVATKGKEQVNTKLIRSWEAFLGAVKGVEFRLLVDTTKLHPDAKAQVADALPKD